MPLIERWTPVRELDVIDRRVRRFFGDLGVLSSLAPPADIYETDGEVVVELEVPGFDEQELEIELADHTLRVLGERREETEKEQKTLRLHERLEKTFARSFALPAGVDAEHVTAAYTKGVLTVHVPKTAHTQPRKVEIART